MENQRNGSSFRRYSQIEVIPKRKSVTSFDHNTCEIHEPPTKDELNKSALLIPEMPAPPPSAMSVISPPSSCGSNSVRKMYATSSNDLGSKVNTSKHKTVEIHKNISAVVRQLSLHITKNRSNEVLPLENTSEEPMKIQTISSKLMSNHKRLPSISKSHANSYCQRNLPDDTLNNNKLTNQNELSKQGKYRCTPYDDNEKKKQQYDSPHSIYVQEYPNESELRYEIKGFCTSY